MLAQINICLLVKASTTPSDTKTEEPSALRIHVHLLPNIDYHEHYHQPRVAQPYDVAVFAPLKAAYYDQVNRLEQGGVNTIGKEPFTSLYKPTRERAFTPKNIKAGFAGTQKYARPLTEPAIPRVDEVKVGSCRQDIEPQTPVTPVSAEAFMSLQNLIIQQDTHTPDETSKQNLARHLQKCTKAFQISSTKTILQEDRIQFLTIINNEAKVRRSTRSLVLGKAKVMSYEDREEARAKRAVKASKTSNLLLQAL
ncbi:transposase protein [Rutstroemia sp. NJR-2017a WRK4]|nr:transposase protein [Rutstroemia sp. NJR-2017a WRK4]